MNKKQRKQQQRYAEERFRQRIADILQFKEPAEPSAAVSDPPRSTAQASTDQSCVVCSKAQESLPEPLKRCAACKAVVYCSIACQKVDWPTHKKVCSHKQPAKAKPETLKFMGQDIPIQTMTPDSFTPFTAMQGNGLLEGLPKQDAYNRLIDAYRFRVEDDYCCQGGTTGLYNGDDPAPGLRRFLTRAEQSDVLPSWWSAKTRKACMKWAVNTNNWSNINFAVEKSDIKEHYGDPMMPMTLRVLAERVYGRSAMEGLGDEGSEDDDSDGWATDE